MAKIYAMSDIHGTYQAFIKALENIDLSNENNQLVLLGDYVDGGDDSLKVLLKIKELETSYPKQVIVLLGNHDLWFLDWLKRPYGEFSLNYFRVEDFYKTINSFLSEEIKSQIKSILKKDGIYGLSGFLANYINQNNQELISYLKAKRKQNYFYETDNQIFVHAGIDEEALEDWMYGTSDEMFYSKYPATTGYFYKDIIAGHVYAHEVANNKEYLGRIYYDGKSHYYIDGNTLKSNVVPVLVYDTKSKKYEFKGEL